MYITLFFGFLIPIYDLENGRLWLLFCLLVAFLGDTSAYYAGKSLGRRTLYPAVSPKKTWEGLGGNVAGAALTGGLYIGLLLPPAWWEGALLGAFLGLWGAGGDLFESMIKRSAGVKDAGENPHGSRRIYGPHRRLAFQSAGHLPFCPDQDRLTGG